MQLNLQNIPEYRPNIPEYPIQVPEYGPSCVINCKIFPNKFQIVSLVVKYPEHLPNIPEHLPNMSPSTRICPEYVKNILEYHTNNPNIPRTYPNMVPNAPQSPTCAADLA